LTYELEESEVWRTHEVRREGGREEGIEKEMEMDEQEHLLKLHTF